MPAALFYHPRPQFTLDSASINAGGTLNFYADGTLTAKSVYSDSALSVSLGNTVTLDAAGRTPTTVFLDGTYRVVEKTSAGVQISSSDGVNIQAAAGTTALNPATGDLDDVYSTDGTSALWRAISEVPSVAGQSGKILGNDGVTAAWEAKATATVYSETSLPGGIIQDATSLQVGKFKIQTGSGTAPSSASQTTSLAVTFPEAYTTLLHVDVTPSVGAVTGESGGVEASATSRSGSGFSATFIAPDMGAVSGSEVISSNVPFTWCAFGIVA